ncbi:MAG: hypothetical protein ACLGXA_00405 [Acidobacteriota bacterium]
MTSRDGIVAVGYTWDSLNRLGTVTDNRLGGTSNTTTYTYDNANNLATVEQMSWRMARADDITCAGDPEELVKRRNWLPK